MHINKRAYIEPLAPSSKGGLTDNDNNDDKGDDQDKDKGDEQDKDKEDNQDGGNRLDDNNGDGMDQHSDHSSCDDVADMQVVSHVAMGAPMAQGSHEQSVIKSCFCPKLRFGPVDKDDIDPQLTRSLSQHHKDAEAEAMTDTHSDEHKSGHDVLSTAEEDIIVRATPKSNSVDNVRALQGDATVLENAIKL